MQKIKKKGIYIRTQLRVLLPLGRLHVATCKQNGAVKQIKTLTNKSFTIFFPPQQYSCLYSPTVTLSHHYIYIHTHNTISISLYLSLFAALKHYFSVCE